VIVFAIAAVVILSKSHPGAHETGIPGGFLITFGAAFGYAAGWNPYASDYTRYQRPDVNRTMVGLWAGFGVFISCVILEIMGAGLATVAGTSWGPKDIPTAQMVHAMPGLLYSLTLAAIVVGAVAANVLNIYSGAMSFLTIGFKLSLHQRRAIVAVISGVIGLAIGIYFQANVGPGSNYENFLLVIAYWIGPWLGVVLTDYWMRKGNFGDETVFYDTGWNSWKGFVAMALGGAVAIYFFADQTAYLGLFPKTFPQFGDLTFLVAFLLAGILYFAFHGGKLNVDARGEEAAA